MKYIDLHVHSLFSDGTCTPEELVDKASAQGLVAFALTDHDTVGGVERALEAAKDKHLQVIPGVELSCEYQITPTRSKEIHILGYNIDWKQKELLDTLEAVAKERDDRNKKMCENLQKAGYPIDYDSLIERFGDTILTFCQCQHTRFFHNPSVPGEPPPALPCTLFSYNMILFKKIELWYTGL